MKKEFEREMVPRRLEGFFQFGECIGHYCTGEVLTSIWKAADKEYKKRVETTGHPFAAIFTFEVIEKYGFNWVVISMTEELKLVHPITFGKVVCVFMKDEYGTESLHLVSDILHVKKQNFITFKTMLLEPVRKRFIESLPNLTRVAFQKSLKLIEKEFSTKNEYRFDFTISEEAISLLAFDHEGFGVEFSCKYSY